MKARNNRRKERLGRARLTTLAVLLPLALGSTAQTPVRWSGVQTASPVAMITATTAQPVDATPVASPRQIAYAPPPKRLVPLAAGFDVQRFESMAQALVANQRVPGLAMAIVKDGHILTARGYGITDVRAAEPVDAHTVFRLASLSKSFAGAVTGLLVSQGALRWDSKLTNYMPALRLSDPTAAQELTVAEVLSQRVGLTHNTYDRDLEANVDYRTLVQKLAYAPMACRPGQCYGYQNIAFSLIGDVVFAVTGKFYGETLASRVFKPLGMNDASTGLEGIESSPRWAKPHVRGGGGWVSLMPKPAYYEVTPAAGVNASISDMAQWLIAQTGHRPDVLSDSLLATLHSPVINTPSELRGSSWRGERLNAAGYALGWRVYDYAGHRVVFHGGAVQGYRGVVALLPESDMGVAILWNSESSLPSGLMPTILDTAIGLTPHWLDGRTLGDTLYAHGADNDNDAPGVESSTAQAKPK
ncbi:serine hydrolase domain-containing protein [Cognatiluteimonas profundi]|uniref:serine hydrolase domain-containing protein n=1 Tax=Cognatiluteimonas profundi TaxID=2594501 RepID=UPI00131C3FD5|nr:serine hydrolase domain-containing protein [Lysobacter profundi]